MLRLLNKWGIPNVVTHRLSEPVLNVMAFLYEKVVQKRNLIEVASCRNNARANYYLSKQFKRLLKYAKNNELDKFNFLAIKLLNSFSFQVQAYNSVFPRWIQVGSFKRHFRYLRNLCHNRSVDLDYKRVWIDKKPGDFARPLGVPSLVWRVYLRMLTNLGEIFIQGRGLYSNFQHGGRPGKGVMTCLIEMVQKFEKFESVYEFDLKGFFDHVSKESVRNFFHGTWLADVYFNLLLKTPKSYTLPSEVADVAYQNYLRIRGEGGLSKLNLIPELENFLAFYDNTVLHGINLSPEEAKMFSKEEAMDLLKLELANMIAYLDNEGLISPILVHGDDPSLKSVYSKLMSYKNEWGESSDIGELTSCTFPYKTYAPIPPSTKDREIGRDNWKDLNLPDQGIPQGSSFGPMLASTIVAYYLRGIPNLLMYVDDGMVFLPAGSTSPENIIKEALKPIKVELALEKSRMRDNLSLHKEGIKFLGTRSHLLTSVRNHMTMTSETRRGTIKAFPVANRENFMTIIEKMYKEKMITISKFREMTLLRHRNSRLFEFLTGQSLNIAIKWGFFGNLLAECYDPNNDPKDIKRKIREGMDRAYEAATINKNSIGHFILKQERWVYIDNQTGKPNVVKPDLFNVSTLACDLLLELGVNDIRKPKYKLPRTKVSRVTQGIKFNSKSSKRL